MYLFAHSRISAVRFFVARLACNGVLLYTPFSLAVQGRTGCLTSKSAGEPSAKRLSKKAKK